MPALNVSQDALVGIFDGSIRFWNDTRLLSRNAALRTFAAQLNESFTVVAPNESEWGPTWQFTSALSQMSPQFNETIGDTPNSRKMPGVNKPVPAEDVPGQILGDVFSVGYTDLRTASRFGLKVARLENAEGVMVPATAQTLNAAAESFTPQLYTADPDHPWVSLANGGGMLTYPIAGTTHLLLRNGNPASCIESYELARFAYWTISDPEPASIAVDLGYVRPNNWTDFAIRKLQNYKCGNGIVLLDQVIADIEQEKTDTTSRVFLFAVSIMAGLVVMLCVGLCGFWAYTRRKRAQKVNSGKSKLVEIPPDVTERTQKELNETVNREALGEINEDFEVPPTVLTGKLPKDDDDDDSEVDSDEDEEDSEHFDMGTPNPDDDVMYPPGMNPVFQTMLVRSSTGALRAVVGPVNYQVEIWNPENSHHLNEKDHVSGFVSESLTRMVGRRKSFSGEAYASSAPEIQVAQPITVKPRWQKSFRIHVASVILRAMMDLVAVVLNWTTLRTFPPGLVLVSVYGALCIIGTLFFTSNLLLAFLGLYLHSEKQIEVNTQALKGRSKVAVDMLAYVKSEIRRLYVISIREMIYRVSMVSSLARVCPSYASRELIFIHQLIREVPLIIVAILIASDAKFIEPLVLLSLVANGIAFGFKVRSVPMTIEDIHAYFDMREVYRLLRKASALGAARKFSASAAHSLPRGFRTAGDVDDDLDDMDGTLGRPNGQQPGGAGIPQGSDGSSDSDETSTYPTMDSTKRVSFGANDSTLRQGSIPVRTASTAYLGAGVPATTATEAPGATLPVQGTNAKTNSLSKPPPAAKVVGTATKAVPASVPGRAVQPMTMNPNAPDLTMARSRLDDLLKEFEESAEAGSMRSEVQSLRQQLKPKVVNQSDDLHQPHYGYQYTYQAYQAPPYQAPSFEASYLSYPASSLTVPPGTYQAPPYRR
jgi:hypothetical protein